MAGNGIVFQDGQTESGKSVGGAGLVLACGIHPKAAISVQQVSGDLGSSASGFAPTEVCHARSPGFPTCSPRLKRRRELASERGHNLQALANPVIDAGQPGWLSPLDGIDWVELHALAEEHKMPLETVNDLLTLLRAEIGKM
jgi:hypothetical protein